jgi:hypothetical protein
MTMDDTLLGPTAEFCDANGSQRTDGAGAVNMVSAVRTVTGVTEATHLHWQVRGCAWHECGIRTENAPSAGMSLAIAIVGARNGQYSDSTERAGGG